MTQIVNILSGTWSDSLDETNDCKRVNQDMKVIFFGSSVRACAGIDLPGCWRLKTFLGLLE